MVSLFFSSPLGLVALLGIPVLLVIHFFQRQSQRYTTPTLFLLRSQFQHQSGGQQFKRFQPSWVLLLQILAVLILAFLLSGPRVKRIEMAQKIAIVVDASASMSAFKDALDAEVERVFHELGKEKMTFLIHLFSALPEEPALYTGDSPAACLEVLQEWAPLSEAVDPTSALSLARSRIGKDGLLLYVTDHMPESALPDSVKLLTIGRPLNNVGFCGTSVKREGEREVARVLMKNYGQYPEQRTYQLQNAVGEILLEKEVLLQPQQVKTISFPFSENLAELCFILPPDDFPLDDSAPVLRPQKKPLALSALGSGHKLRSLSEKLAQVVGASFTADSSALPDLLFQAQGRLQLPTTHSVTFIKTEEGESFSANIKQIVPAPSPLVKDLVWDSLIIPEAPSFPPSARDQVLLWAGADPLISLRITTHGQNSYQHLLCNFPLEGANLDTQANLALLLFRFCEEIRAQKKAYFTEVGEVNQAFNALMPPAEITSETPLSVRSALHYAPAYQRDLTTPAQLRGFKLPAEPNLLRFTQGNQEIAMVSTHFADAREADFSQATTQQSPPLVTEAERLKSSKPLPFLSLFLLVLLIFIMSTWMLHHQKNALSSVS